MSITHRIIAIFAILGTAILVVAGMGMQAVNVSQNVLDEINEASAPMMLLGKMERIVHRAARDAQKVRSAFVPPAKERAQAELADTIGQLQRLTSAMGFLIDDPSASKQELIEALEAYAADGATLAGATEATDGEVAAASSRALLAVEELEAMFAETVQDELSAQQRARQDAEAKTQRILIMMGAVCLATLVGGIAVALLIARRGITRPLNAVTNAIDALANGDLDVVIPATGRRDEIGRLGRSTELFREALRAAETKRRALEASEAERGEREERAKQELVARLDADVASVVRTLSAAANQLSSSAATLRGNAESSDQRATRVSEAAEETSGNVQAVASAAEELAASAREIGTQVSQSTAISMEALEQAESATQVVHGLSVSAQKIGQVVDLIENIASQTNLLALNATIEAARAGDAGKGFAVVAMEVKSLAEQTGNATKEISTQISAVQGDVQRVVEAIERMQASFTRANELTSSVASAIEEQSTATSNIAQSVHQAAVSTQDVSSTIVDVSQAANDTGRGASDIVSAAEDLSTQADTLRTRMASFIDAFRNKAA